MRPRRRLAASFVVTTCTLATACNSQRETLGPTVNPPAPPTPSASATAVPTLDPRMPVTPPGLVPPAKPTAKRTRTKPDPGYGAAPPVSPMDGAEADTLNPADPSGRTVFLAPDDTCYTESPAPPSTPAGPTGSRSVVANPVDCPKAMNDPAWDTCSGSRLLRSRKTGECACAPMGGNPPPPPQRNACPAKGSK